MNEDTQKSMEEDVNENSEIYEALADEPED